MAHLSTGSGTCLQDIGAPRVFLRDHDHAESWRVTLILCDLDKSVALMSQKKRGKRGDARIRWLRRAAPRKVAGLAES